MELYTNTRNDKIIIFISPSREGLGRLRAGLPVPGRSQPALFFFRFRKTTQNK